MRLKAVLDLYDTSIKDPTCISPSPFFTLPPKQLLTRPSSTDSTGFFWSGIECSLAIVCASIPSLKPFFAVHFPKLLGSSFGSRYGPNSQGKVYNYGGPSRSRSNGYALGSFKGDKSDNPFPSASTQPHIQATTVKGMKRDNESEESIIHGAGIVRTTDVRVEVESINSAEDKHGKGIAR